MENRVWTRDGYEVVEVKFDADLQEFTVVKEGGEVATIITPADLEAQAQIVRELDAGENVNGWEDGNGNEVRL